MLKLSFNKGLCPTKNQRGQTGVQGALFQNSLISQLDILSNIWYAFYGGEKQ